jgi:octaprenyl-diphosphate synthase
VLEAIQSTDALEYARDAARREAEAAAGSIGALPPSVYRDSLLELAAFSVTRRS